MGSTPGEVGQHLYRLKYRFLTIEQSGARRVATTVIWFWLPAHGVRGPCPTHFVTVNEMWSAIPATMFPYTHDYTCRARVPAHAVRWKFVLIKRPSVLQVGRLHAITELVRATERGAATGGVR